jgi:uncharacterized protein (TIGR02099 family)
VDHIEAEWNGDWREPASFKAKVGFSGIGLTAPAPWPSIGPLDGQLALSDQDGDLQLSSNHFSFQDSDVYEKPLSFDRFHANVGWRRAGRAWEVRLNEFSALNTEMAANATAIWQWPGQGSGNLILDAEVPHLLAAKISDYLPNAVGKETRDWLRNALKGGEARDAHFTLHGPLDKFPFDDGKAGVWKIAAQIKDVTLDYAPAWPHIENINGEFHIDGDKLQVVGNGGQILGTHIEHADAVIPKLSHADAIRVDGQVAGPTPEFFRFVAQSPLERTLGGIGTLSRSGGDAKLALKLDVPFANADDTHVDGELRVVHNHLQIGDSMPELKELAGMLHFNEHGADAHGLQALSLGGPAKIDVTTGKDGVVQVSASGRADARLAAQRYELPLAESLSGMTDYRAQVNIPSSGWQLALDAGLRDVRADLPAPLGKPLGEVRSLRLGLEADSSSERWRVALGNQLGLMLIRNPQGSIWRTTRGELRLGDVNAMASRSGFWVTGSLPGFNADAWLAKFDGGGSAGAATPSLSSPLLSGVEARIGKLQIAGNRIDDLTLQATQNDGSWQINASSQQIEGRATWSPTGRERLFARLARLKLPLPDGEPTGGQPGSSKHHLPAVDLVADEFLLNSHPLGRLDVKAQPNRDSWLIDSLTLVNADGKLNMHGSWSSAAEDDRTNVKVEIESTDIGKLLGRFGYPELMRRGTGGIDGELSWHGSPLSPEYASLTGSIKVRAAAGQFAKVDPGVGRLLGVLSLQSLPRRLTLDFRDIFSEGFAFDRIEGDSKVNKGVISTSNLSIVGPAAKVQFKGEADLNNETQKLRVRIVPTVGDSIAVGAGVALANPVVGVGAYVLQRMLKDPLGQLVAYEYDISGKWDDPQIVRVGGPGKVKPPSRQP